MGNKISKKHNIDEWDDIEDFGTGQFIDDGSLFDEIENSDDFDLENDMDEVYFKDNDTEYVKKHKKTKSKTITEHSLDYDSIFNGRKNDEEEDESEHYIKEASWGAFSSDMSLDDEESENSIDYHRKMELKSKILVCLENNTDIDLNILSVRRKPSRGDFNAYFQLLITDLKKYNYTHTEIFIELYQYFGENVWNYFQLLNVEYSNIIIQELKESSGLSDMDQINWLE